MRCHVNTVIAHVMEWKEAEQKEGRLFSATLCIQGRSTTEVTIACQYWSQGVIGNYARQDRFVVTFPYVAHNLPAFFS